MDKLEPFVGDWLVIRDWGLGVRQITKITPKMYKLGAGSRSYPRQVERTSKKVVCHAANRISADRLASAISGIDGEFNRRRRAADDEHNARVSDALSAREQAIADLLAREAARG